MLGRVFPLSGKLVLHGLKLENGLVLLQYASQSLLPIQKVLAFAGAVGRCCVSVPVALCSREFCAELVQFFQQLV